MTSISDLPVYLRNRIEIDEDHWMWCGSVRPSGYGQTWSRAPWSSMLAHRAVYEAAHGRVPPELHHSCHVKLCVNPDHLVPIDHARHTTLHNMTERCAYGHEWTEANTYARPDGKGRQCRACSARRQNVRYRANPAADIAANVARRRRKRQRLT